MPFTPANKVIQSNNFTSASDVLMQKYKQDAAPKKDGLQKASDIVGSIFPGQEIGKALGNSIDATIQTVKGGIKTIKGDKEGAKQAFDNAAHDADENNANYSKIAGDTAQVALSGVPELAGVKTLTGRLAANTVIGAGLGTANAVAQGKPAKEIAKSAAIGGGIGLVTGGASEGISAGLKGIAAKRAIQAGAELDHLTGTVTQGTTADITKAKAALANIDTTGIKTYDDLATALDDKISHLSKGLDTKLGSDTATKTLDDLNFKVKVGDSEIEHNYVKDALAQLKDHFNATNDVAGLEKITQLESKAASEGLTVKEINDIAKEHGQAINAFNANGQAASGLTKQAAENTRKGLKATAREIFDDPVYKAADSQISNLIRTRDLVSNVSEKVNQLKQKVTERGFGENVGRLVFQVVDKFTGGGLKGFVQSFIPRGQGLKVMNALDLEKALGGNLKKIQNALDSGTESEMIKNLESLLGGQASEPFLNNQQTNNTANTTFKNIANSVAPKPSIVKKLSTAIKDTPNKQGGFVSIPTIAKKMDATDKGIILDFIDAVNTGKTPSKAAAAKAQALASKMGLKSELGTNKALAKEFTQILDTQRSSIKKKLQ